LKERTTDPFERPRLYEFIPNPQLAEHFSKLATENRKKKALHPDAGDHNLAHFRMMSRVVLNALEYLHKDGDEDGTSIVLGAKECTDVPLDALAAEGLVYLVDVDAESLRVARSKTGDPSVRARVETVSMDASLFENALLGKAQGLFLENRSDIDRAFQAIVAMNRDAGQGAPDPLAGTRLPIWNDSVGLVVSSMTLSQFMIGYIQILVKMFLAQYGREETRRYFLAGSPGGAGLEGSERIDELTDSTTALARGSARKHVREVGRITRPGGVVVLSDHALHGRCGLTQEDAVEVDMESLGPYSKNPGEEKSLRFREDLRRRLPAVLRTDRTRPDSSFIVDGKDSLKSVVEKDGRMEILDERGWWWVTERVKETESRASAWNVSYVEAFILRVKK
jgi:SAM-dependent methyltransferase